MSITLRKTDFEVIGQVAVHCNLDRLNLATAEAAEFDLKPLLCDMYYDVVDAWDGEGSDDNLNDLIEGCEFENCAENIVEHKGLKKLLAYYAYARYIHINDTEDTATGVVKKQRDFSIPISEKELAAKASRYTSMAWATWKEIRNYICLQGADIFPKFDFTTCPEDCPCGNGCGRTRVGGRRIRMTTINRK